MKNRFNPFRTIGEAISKMPSEETLNRFLDELPRIEHLLTSEMLEKITRLGVLADAFENGKIDRLINLAPLLDNIPSEKTLADIADMKPYLERLPSSAELGEFVGLLRDVRGFLGALKGL